MKQAFELVVLVQAVNLSCTATRTCDVPHSLHLAVYLSCKTSHFSLCYANATAAPHRSVAVCSFSPNHHPSIHLHHSQISLCSHICGE